MKKTMVLGLGLAALSATATADIGIGASLKSDDASIYIPWQITPQFRLEGEFRVLQVESEQLRISSFSPDPRPYNQDQDIKEYGLGFFWTPQVNEDLQLLLGLRANRASNQSSVSQVASPTQSYSSETDLDGSEFAPTLGLEYALTSQVKLAVEINYFRRDLDGKTTTTQTGSFQGSTSSSSDMDVIEKGSNTRVVLRYFF